MKYFPREINIQTINYLDEKVSLYLLKILDIQQQYYTSKLYHRLSLGEGKNLNNDNEPYFGFGQRYLVDKFIVYNSNELRIVSNLKVKHIKFGDDFDKPVDSLSDEIIHLEFGDTFNQSINNLPKN